MVNKGKAMTDPYVLRAAPPDLCLAYVNTRYWRGQAAPTETLHGVDDLIAFGREQAALPAALLAAQAKLWEADSFRARADFDRAIALREALNRLFGARVLGAQPLGSDLTLLESLLTASPRRARLLPANGAFAWQVEGAPDLSLLLAPVLWSAADLLAGPIGAQVRRCANPDCLYLFIDTSRAGNRRWCSMSSCGNRAKARRHYHRAKQSDQS
jgi:predicted RNA-binding Zn ribbon-like protein